MANIKHDIWEDSEGLTMLCFSGDIGKESRTLLEPNSKIIHSFFAVSHFDAMTKYYEFMDYGIYDSVFEEDRSVYDKNELAIRAKIRFEIDEILWNDWDPIGVNDYALRDEYQSYVHRILNLIMGGNSIDEISKELYHIESDIMGLFGNKNKCLEIAKKI